MKVLIDGKEYDLSPDSSGLVKITFTKQTKDAIEIGELENCSGTTLIDEIQIEQGNQATPYEDPNLILGNATGLISEIRGLEYAISDPKTGLRSQITMLAQGFEQEVNDAIGNYSVQGQTVDGLFAEISKVNGNINRIIQNADGTSQLITNLNNDYQSIKSTANLYERIIGSTGDEINQNVSRIIQTSDVIQMEVAKMDLATNEALTSKITQLADNINLKVSKSDLISQINVQAGGVLITSGTNKLNVTPETTYIEDSTIKSAMIESLEADKIKTGTLDAGKVKVINLDADSITGNLTEFIKSNWNEATGGGVTITGGGVRAINSEGSRVTLENGVVSVGNRAGVNLGFFGDHVLNKSSTGTMTITASYGTETAFISATGTDGKTYKRSMSIMSGASEIDMFTTLDMNKNSLKDVTDIGFTGGHIKGNIDGNYRYMTIDAGTGTSFDVSGTTRMSITSVVNIFSGIDMKGKDIASVGKLTYNSDQRLKTNIKDTNIRALDAIRNWQLVSYDWLESGEHVEIGLIAQNSPEVMTYNDESDIYGIDAGKQTMINTLAIQQLDSKTHNEISQLKAQIASLQDELALLKGD